MLIMRAKLLSQLLPGHLLRSILVLALFLSNASESGWPRVSAANELKAMSENPSDNNRIQHGTGNHPDTSVAEHANELPGGLQPEQISAREGLYSSRNLADTSTDNPSSLVGFFCVASPNADSYALQLGLDWACGPGSANCIAIQPGQPCYVANNVAALASYAYNDYYHRTQVDGGTCNFNNTAMVTRIDPSFGSCIYAGSSTGTGGLPPPSTNSSTGGGFVPNPASPPTVYDNSAPSQPSSEPAYLAMLMILPAWFI